MTWTRLPDDFTDRPAVLAVSRSARLLHVEALVYGNRHLTDGFLPRGALPRITDSPNPESDVAELVAAGLWTPTDGGWQVDWSDQEAAEEVRARKDKHAETQRLWRRHQNGKHDECRPTWSCRKGRDGHGDGHVNGHVTPSRPVPSRPDPKGGTGQGTGRSAPTGSAGAPPVGAPRSSQAEPSPLTWTELPDGRLRVTMPGWGEDDDE